MKSLRNLLILALVAVVCIPAFAQSKRNVLLIDPRHPRPVPVYTVDSKGRPNKSDSPTVLYPGDLTKVKEVRNGWFIIRAMGADGKEIEMAIDPESVGLDKNGKITSKDPAASWAAPNARKLKIGADETLGVPGPGEDEFVCAMDPDICFNYQGGDEVDVEDTMLAQTTSGGTTNLKWKNYYKNGDVWIDSNQTNGVDESWSMLPVPNSCDASSVSPVTMEQLNDFVGVRDEIELKIGTENLDKLMEHLGDCHSMDTVNYHDKIINNMDGKKLPQILKDMQTEPGKTEQVHANKADWVAMDVLARTLYAEMAGCFAKGSKYPESVAKVVTNRVDFAEKNPKRASLFITHPRTDLRNDVTNVLFKDKQFSVWNREDAARKLAMCPPQSGEKPFWKGKNPKTGKEILPDQKEQKIWREAVRIASEAVLRGKRFRTQKHGLNALYYTGNYYQLNQANFTLLTKAHIGGEELPVSSCLQLWSANDITEQQAQILHPLFRKALKAIAGN